MEETLDDSTRNAILNQVLGGGTIVESKPTSIVDLNATPAKFDNLTVKNPNLNENNICPTCGQKVHTKVTETKAYDNTEDKAKTFGELLNESLKIREAQDNKSQKVNQELRDNAIGISRFDLIETMLEKR